jgi:hypothetical protein
LSRVSDAGLKFSLLRLQCDDRFLHYAGGNAVFQGLNEFLELPLYPAQLALGCGDGGPCHILKTNGHAAPGKLADAEIHFSGGELDGLKLVGFAIWRSRDGHGQNVSFPSRHFAVRGDRRSFSVLRWTTEREPQRRLAAAVLEAYRHNGDTNGIGDGEAK